MYAEANKLAKLSRERIIKEKKNIIFLLVFNEFLCCRFKIYNKHYISNTLVY